MGISPFSKSCSTNIDAVSPNPSPDNWELLEMYHGKNGYVLKVKYLGCTNFEGIKILVYRGTYIERIYLDPHFTDVGNSPIARFIPTSEGLQMALDLVKEL